MANIVLKGINKIYPNNVHAVFDFNLEIKDREFIVFVGPSGCGKSTTLRMIAGLEEITSGEFYLDGKLMNFIPPKDRNVAMVFQNYALYPHMSVYRNMAYGISINKEYLPIYEKTEAINVLLKDIKNHKRKLKAIVRKMNKNEDDGSLKEAYDAEFIAIKDLSHHIIQTRKPLVGIDTKRIKRLEKIIASARKEIDMVTGLLNQEINEGTHDEELMAIYSQDIANHTAILKENEALLKELMTKESEILIPRRLYRYEIDAEVFRAAEILDLSRYLHRLPSALSGGQRQRVALGRAIVRKPKVFLMDEPLSNLDAKLRVQTRGEILNLHRRIGATTIYVTHDQTEAMTLADRIVIMKDGYIQQIAAPMDAFNHPANIFVASFIGSPAMNFIKGEYRDGVFRSHNGLFELEVRKEQRKILDQHHQSEIVLGIRPENIFLSETGPFTLEVATFELLGNEMVIYTKTDDQDLAIKVPSASAPPLMGKQCFDFERDKLYFFDGETTNRID